MTSVRSAEAVLSSTDAAPRPLRVLQVIETGGPGGAETVYAQLATGLRERGHEVRCLVARGSWLPAEMTRRGFDVEYIPRGRGSALRFIRQVRDLLRDEAMDLVHAHLFDGAMYSAVAARLAEVPIVATLHGQVDLRHGGMKQRAKHALFRALVTRAVAVSHALERDLQPALRMPPARMTVVHNGLERSVTTALPPRERPAIGGDALRLLAVGNIRPAKDYPTLLRAVRTLLDRNVSVTLDVAGQPDGQGLYESVVTLQRELGLEQTVRFLGFVPNPLPLLGGADVFVLSSSQEGFSLATIEAMLARVPVVATRSGGPEEIIRDGETGLLVPVREPTALADAVQALAMNDSRRLQLAEAAFADAAARFSVSRMVQAYEALYASCLRV